MTQKERADKMPEEIYAGLTIGGNKFAESVEEYAIAIPFDPPTKYIRADLQARAVDVWQPIETAPDDEDVLVLCGRTVIQAFHDDREDGWCLVTPKRHKKYGLLYGFTFGEDIKPTHWMPLPEPPEEG